MKQKKSNSQAQLHLPALDLFCANFFARGQLTSLLLISPGICFNLCLWLLMLVKYTWYLTSTETIRLIRDGGMGRRGMEVGEEGEYIPIATLSPPE